MTVQEGKAVLRGLPGVQGIWPQIEVAKTEQQIFACCSAIGSLGASLCKEVGPTAYAAVHEAAGHLYFGMSGERRSFHDSRSPEEDLRDSVMYADHARKAYLNWYVYGPTIQICAHCGAMVWGDDICPCRS